MAHQSSWSSPTAPATRAQHTFYAERLRRDGKGYVHFGVHPLRGRRDLAVSCTCELFDQQEVRNSGGPGEKRWVIETQLRFGDEEWLVEITLTDRDSMLFRMLLGRTAIAGRMLADPRASYLVGGRPDLDALYPESTVEK